MPLSRKAGISWKISLPTIIAQMTSIAMQYIDSAMVGSLGADATAAIGLVSSTIWFFNGVTFAAVYGFAVQIAQAVGADNSAKARNIFRQGLKASFLYALLMAAISGAISGRLPVWLGGESAIIKDASAYFLTIAVFMPVNQIRFYCAGCLQATGDTRTPGILSVLLCVLNVILNALFIPGEGMMTLGTFSFRMHGLGLGVFGAALATGLSGLVIAAAMFFAAAVRNGSLKIVRGEKAGFQKEILLKALRISAPAAFEQGAISGAMVATTRIVAPLGTVAVAANSLAITAESFCYMPGYGLEASATTLVGQSIGAGHGRLAVSFAWITTAMGMIMMTAMGVLMYFICPAVFVFLTPDAAVRALGVNVLRIELFAEPFFGASIVAAGALRGAGDTLIPSIMNLASIWGVRLTLAILLAGRLGLTGVWIAMFIELCFRGIIFLIRMKRGKWMKAAL
ncbi:MAG: MATE family efflux transporter [Lachnospiraceae bacterium]|nr:MATE family efflux transporter [Lachnospiraceae bacterium]